MRTTVSLALRSRVKAVRQRLALPVEESTAPRRNGEDPRRHYVTSFRYGDPAEGFKSVDGGQLGRRSSWTFAFRLQRPAPPR